MPSKLLQYRTWLIAIFQAVLILTALVLAWLLRFDFALPDRALLFLAAPILVAIRLTAIGKAGLFHGWWRYTGINDAVDVVKAIAIGSACFLLLMRFFLGIVAFPRTVYILEALLSLGFLVGVRFISRLLTESMSEMTATRRRVMLIGAGAAAQMVIREIKRLKNTYEAVGCVDDDQSKRGIKLQGVPVVGTVDQLPTLLAASPVDEVLIAVPSASGKQMQRFVQICEQSGIRFKTVPALRDILSGQVNIREFRDVHLEDLLGRDPVEIDLRAVTNQIEGRVVLVTGAAGSIGSELCRQILEYGPATLICLDQSETGIFYLEQELSRKQTSAQSVFCVADVGDQDRVNVIFSEYLPEIVFHAAAYKHVPVMERNVPEAMNNNVFALLSLLEIAEDNGCKGFVLISSDKAVNPTSIMGATKRIGELITASRPSNGMRCVSVRFGNVLGSNGSVVPLFQEQIRRNEPLSITHPEIKRYFMTGREAVSLVLQAFAIGKHGDTLVLDMGEPVRILDLARTLIRLSGRTEREVSIRFTGLREGEKLKEELYSAAEEIFPTPFEKIKSIRSPIVSWSQLQRQLNSLRASLRASGAEPVRRKVKEIVPEYTFNANSHLPPAKQNQLKLIVQPRLVVNSVPIDGD
ncbi:MAG: nucleoside-diphosphate sugar epimerase/dehydratase [Candidatus Acidiferrum sp.]